MLLFRTKRVRCLMYLAHNGSGVFGAKRLFLASINCVEVLQARLILQVPRSPKFWPKVCNAITRQPIELESRSNHLRIQQFCQLKLKKKFSFGFVVLWGMTSQVGVSFSFYWTSLGLVHPVLDANPMSQLFRSSFFQKLGYRTSLQRP